MDVSIPRLILGGWDYLVDFVPRAQKLFILLHFVEGGAENEENFSILPSDYGLGA